MAKRDPERWGQGANERPETQINSWGQKWKENKKLDIQPVRYVNRYIKCSAGTGHCLRITQSMLKQAKARKALKILEYTMDKQSGIPGSMLKGELARAVEVEPGLVIKAQYLGRGKWKFNIVG